MKTAADDVFGFAETAGTQTVDCGCGGSCGENCGGSCGGDCGGKKQESAQDPYGLNRREYEPMWDQTSVRSSAAAMFGGPSASGGGFVGALFFPDPSSPRSRGASNCQSLNRTCCRFPTGRPPLPLPPGPTTPGGGIPRGPGPVTPGGDIGRGIDVSGPGTGVPIPITGGRHGDEFYLGEGRRSYSDSYSDSYSAMDTSILPGGLGLFEGSGRRPLGGGPGVAGFGYPFPASGGFIGVNPAVRGGGRSQEDRDTCRKCGGEWNDALCPPQGGPPTCCCCVEELRVTQIDPATFGFNPTSNTWVGNAAQTQKERANAVVLPAGTFGGTTSFCAIPIRIDVKFRYVGSGTKCHCNLEWWERLNRDQSDSGVVIVPKKKWTDVLAAFAQSPRSGTGGGPDEGWVKYKNARGSINCPSTYDLVQYDAPRAKPGDKQYVDMEIRATSCRDCSANSCTNNQLRIKCSFHLAFSRGFGGCMGSAVCHAPDGNLDPWVGTQPGRREGKKNVKVDAPTWATFLDAGRWL